jgi:hypothetical protein
LTTTVYTGEVPPRFLTRDEILGTFRRAVKFYECSCRGLHESIEPSNTDAGDLARQIYNARNRITALRVLLISDGLAGLGSVDIKEAFDGTRVIVDLFGIERLYRILGEGLTRDDIVIEFYKELGAPLPCLKAPVEGAGYDAYLAAIPGSLLADVYEKYGTRLLEFNVRAFLGLRGKKSVNAGLRATIQTAPQNFLAYNNGVVATVSGIELEEIGDNAIGVKSIRGLQIVNGGQTTASLHRARRDDDAKLGNVAVPLKIIRVDGSNLEEMVTAVSRPTARIRCSRPISPPMTHSMWRSKCWPTIPGSATERGDGSTSGPAGATVPPNCLHHPNPAARFDLPTKRRKSAGSRRRIWPNTSAHGTACRISSAAETRRISSISCSGSRRNIRTASSRTATGTRRSSPRPSSSGPCRPS